jgi:uncharacterized membrane protein YqhA
LLPTQNSEWPHFIIELFHLIGKAAHIEEKEIMLTVLGLIDVVMIATSSSWSLLAGTKHSSPV